LGAAGVSGRAPFDGERAQFWLRAVVVGVICLVTLVVVAMCSIYAAAIVAGTFTCDKNDRVLELLMLAFGAANLQGRPPPPPSPPAPPRI
jgi:hypothetical protein